MDKFVVRKKSPSDSDRAPKKQKTEASVDHDDHSNGDISIDGKSKSHDTHGSKNTNNGTTCDKIVGSGDVCSTPPANGQSNGVKRNEPTNSNAVPSSSLKMHGLRNQGATCYLNSLLQTYFHLGALRKSVYAIPTNENQDQKQKIASIPLALQRLFFQMQFGNQSYIPPDNVGVKVSVETKELTRAFGWKSYQTSMQQDIQELNSILRDRLEAYMKGTPVEGTISKIFCGEVLNYVKCKNVDFKSTRTEKFHDLSLNVRGFTHIYASLDAYVSEQTLTGENQYDAGKFGKQDAVTGCKFLSFPPVLYIQLKRFEYNWNTGTMNKINDRFCFPDELRLNRYLDEQANKETDYTYSLFGVMVHSGYINRGHYYAFIKTQGDQWYKFNDEYVCMATEKEAISDNFGTGNMQSNAYMVVYVRKSLSSSIIQKLTEHEAPAYIADQFQQERANEELRLKNLAEAPFCIVLKVAVDNDIEQQCSADIDFVDFDRVKQFRVKKTSSLQEFKQIAAESYGIPVERQRYWYMSKTPHNNFRPLKPIPENELLQAVQDNTNLFNSANRVYLQDTLGTVANLETDVLIFVKYYNPPQEKLSYLGHVVLPNSTWVSELAGNWVAKWLECPSTEHLIAFVEHTPRITKIADGSVTLAHLKLAHGSILVFQKAISAKTKEIRHPTPLEYYPYYQNRVFLDVRKLEDHENSEFVLEVSRSTTYDDLAQEIADRVGASDLLHIRLTTHHRDINRPQPHPLARVPTMTLEKMLYALSCQPSLKHEIVYYEKLKYSIEQLQHNIEFKVYWCDSATCLREHHFLVSKQGVIKDLVKLLKEAEKVDGDIRIMQVGNSRIRNVFHPEDKLYSIQQTSKGIEYISVIAEKIPPEESQMIESDRKVQVIYFVKAKPVLLFRNVPFYMVVSKDETFGHLKGRIKQKLELEDEVWNRFTLHLIVYNNPRELDDNETVADKDFDYIGIQLSSDPYTRSVPESSGVLKNYLALSINDRPGEQ